MVNRLLIILLVALTGKTLCEIGFKTPTEVFFASNNTDPLKYNETVEKCRQLGGHLATHDDVSTVLTQFLPNALPNAFWLNSSAFDVPQVDWANFNGSDVEKLRNSTDLKLVVSKNGRFTVANTSFHVAHPLCQFNLLEDDVHYEALSHADQHQLLKWSLHSIRSCNRAMVTFVGQIDHIFNHNRTNIPPQNSTTGWGFHLWRILTRLAILLYSHDDLYSRVTKTRVPKKRNGHPSWFTHLPPSIRRRLMRMNSESWAGSSLFRLSVMSDWTFVSFSLPDLFSAFNSHQLSVYFSSSNYDSQFVTAVPGTKGSENGEFLSNTCTRCLMKYSSQLLQTKWWFETEFPAVDLPFKCSDCWK